MAEVYLPRGVTKNVLSPGRGEIPLFIDGTKATFDFRTFLDDEDKTEIDDSKVFGEPFVLLFGKKFKLEVWEDLIQTMRIGEIASFHCKSYVSMRHWEYGSFQQDLVCAFAEHVKTYPVVSKSLRDIKKKKDGKLDENEKQHHSCAFDAIHRGIGYADLDNVLRNDIDLIFEILLIDVKQPGSYEQELWTMTSDERFKKIPELKELGNKQFKDGNYEKAAEYYSQGLGCLEQLVMREKPGDEEWKKLDDMKVPFLLNYSQCKLHSQDYYQVIKHTSTVLERHPENVKALFRRAKAHAAVWNPDEAVKDFQQAMQLDSSLTKCITKELQKIQDASQEKLDSDKQKWKSLFTT
eukprot:gene13957-15413_t